MPKLDNSPATATIHQRTLKTKLTLWGAGLTQMNSDTVSGSAIVGFTHKNTPYLFRYNTPKNSATSNLNTLCFSLCALINLDIRGIFPFEKTGHEYIALPGGTAAPAPYSDYSLFELPSTCTDTELKTRYYVMLQTLHPDRSLSEEQRKYMEAKTSELNVAYANLKKQRGMK